MLNAKEMASLAVKLEVPLVVGDIMDGGEPLTDDIQYALHTVISDLQPDSALLAIAASARKIAGFYIEASAGMKVLAMECDRIIGEYGTLWLKNAQDETISNDNVYETLMHTPEDLEGLSELLEINSAFLRSKDWQAAALCDILFIQAGAHATIAEEFISMIETADEDSGEPSLDTVFVKDASNNVIPFRSLTRAE